ncbi:MAG: rod shape-determining protein MreC [Deinococcales bacterium]|nr:rod shape-determining protein MreC [Deinococcales bacterium]
MSSLLRAWYVFVALGLATFLVTAFVGRVPADLTAAVALPHELLHRAGVNVRLTLESAVDRRELREEVARLQAELALAEQRQRALELEVERLELAGQVRGSQSPAVVATAPVVGGDTGPEVARLRVGLGASAGLQRNMPVTAPAGLVGIVTEVASRSAVVRTVLDPQSRVGVTVRGKGGQGVAVGDAGGLVRVTRFILDEPVEVGDVVETSSYGGLFPAGVRLGEVAEVLPPDPNDLRHSFLVRPSVELATLRQVVLLAPQ